MNLQDIFSTVLNMSMTGSVVIVFVLLARLLLKKAPKVFSYALWAGVLFRLLCPVSISSALSLLNLTRVQSSSSEGFVSTVDYAPAVDVYLDMPSMAEPPVQEPRTSNEAAHATVVILPEKRAEVTPTPDTVSQQAAAEPVCEPIYYAVIIWLVGLGVMLIYNAVSCIKLFRQLTGAVHLRKNIYLGDHIPTPFVLGVIRPRIYLPSTLGEMERRYIIAHERCHIRRKDHLVRLLAYLALCLHWFNPLVWLAFNLSGKDMEMSCDEAVLRMYGPKIRAEYSASLLRLATGHRSFALTPLAFGEGDTKGRVMNMAKWKKPGFWVTICALVLCVSVLAACAMNPSQGCKTGQFPWDENMDVSEICIQAIENLKNADSYYIVCESESSEVTGAIEYYRHGNDLLIQNADQRFLGSTIFFDGKYGMYYGDYWEEETDKTDFDPNEWLNRWSPEGKETESWSVSENTITFDAKWMADPVKHTCEGVYTFKFNDDSTLNEVQREYRMFISGEYTSVITDHIYLMEKDEQTVYSIIKAVADQCISKEEQLQPRQEIHVSTVDEFIAAIGPNTEIILDAELYDFSTASGYGTSSGDYYFWEDNHDGPGLVIRNVDNMVIRSSDGNVKGHTLVAVPRYADVLGFRACSNITVSGFTAGHTLEQGSCTGGVLDFADSEHILVENCGLFGCGTLGVETASCSDITVKNCEIFECSEGGVKMRDSTGIRLEGTAFRDIGGRNYIWLINCKDAKADGEVLISADSLGSVKVATPEQQARNDLDAAVHDFVNYYFFDKQEEMSKYLAESYSGSGKTHNTGDSSNKSMYFEITHGQVAQIDETGSCIIQIPYRPTQGSEDIAYLLITVVKENGEYKISDYELQQ